MIPLPKLTEADLDQYEAEKQAMYDELVAAQSAWQSQWQQIEDPTPNKPGPLFAECPRASAAVGASLFFAFVAVLYLIGANP